MMLDVAYVTNAGGRTINQDSVGYANADNAWCLAVADGVGGYNYGEYASQLAVQNIKQSFLCEPNVNENTLRAHIETNSRLISEIVDENPSLNTMRTTLAVLYINEKKVVAGHIGDSRIYFFRDNKIFYISRDHSLVMQMVLRGELCVDDIRGHSKRNVITSAIGKDPPKKIDTASFDLSVSYGDGFLLCSDGFWELVTEEEMLELLSRSTTAGQWVRAMEQLVGNRQSGRSDNYTCLAARLSGK